MFLKIENFIQLIFKSACKNGNTHFIRCSYLKIIMCMSIVPLCSISINAIHYTYNSKWNLQLFSELCSFLALSAWTKNYSSMTRAFVISASIYFRMNSHKIFRWTYIGNDIWKVNFYSKHTILTFNILSVNDLIISHWNIDIKKRAIILLFCFTKISSIDHCYLCYENIV